MNLSEEKFFEELAKGMKNPQADSDSLEEEVSSPPPAPPKEIKEKTSKKQGDKDELGSLEPEGKLTLDVYQSGNDIIIQSAIAGVKPEDLDIDVSTDSVTIRGQRHRDDEIEEDNYFYRECYWGRFSRSIILPQEVDPEAASVSFKNGVLTVRLPKLNRKRSKKLKVKSE